MEILTNSRKAAAQKCLRYHQLAYELGLRRDVDALPLRIGRAVHVGLDVVKTGGEPNDAILHALATYDAGVPLGLDPEAETAWLIEREQIGAMLSGYFWRWSNMPIEWIASEQRVDMPLINPATGAASRIFTVAGILDGIARLPDGRIVVVEHKTTGDGLDVDSDYWKRLRIDSQISIYWLAAKAMGHKIAAVLYDVIRKPTIRPKKLTKAERAKVQADNGAYCGRDGLCDPADVPERETPGMYGARLLRDIAERPDFYYARREFPRLESDLDEARCELWQMAKLIRDCQRLRRWPRNTGACVGFGRCCYFDLCTGHYDPESGEVPDGFVRVANVHPELATKETDHDTAENNPNSGPAASAGDGPTDSAAPRVGEAE